LRKAACGFFVRKLIACGFFFFLVLVVQGMLYSSHGNVQEQKEHNPAGGFESCMRLWRSLSIAQRVGYRPKMPSMIADDHRIRPVRYGS
jgi:hypothetical protein